jgi:hypothetical protein
MSPRLPDANDAQSLATLQGKILRIDVDRKDGAENYAVPANNSFADRRGRASLVASNR